MTESELRVTAATAILRQRRIPKNGNEAPAAIGMPRVL